MYKKLVKLLREGGRWHEVQEWENDAADAIEALQATATEYQQAADKMAMEHKIERDALRQQLAEARRDAVPTEVTEVAQVAIEAMLKEYNYPANTTNAARAGWRACRLHIAAMKGTSA